jgi:hypothetical protein
LLSIGFINLCLIIFISFNGGPTLKKNSFSSTKKDRIEKNRLNKENSYFVFGNDGKSSANSNKSYLDLNLNPSNHFMALNSCTNGEASFGPFYVETVTGTSAWGATANLQGAPDGTIAAIFSNTSNFQQLLDFDRVIPAGAKLTFRVRTQAGHNNEFQIAYSTDNSNFTTHSDTIQITSTSLVNEIITGEESFRYIRIRGVTNNSHLHFDAVGVTYKECAMAKGMVYLDNGQGGGVYNDSIQNGSENGKNLPAGLFANIVQADTIVYSGSVNDSGEYFIPDLSNGTFKVVLANIDTATTSILPDLYHNSSDSGAYSITVASKSITSPNNLPNLGIHGCEFGNLDVPQYAIDSDFTFGAPNNADNNAIGPPNYNGAFVLGSNNIYFWPVLEYKDTFRAGDELTITAKFVDHRKDGMLLEFSSDNTNWSATTDLINQFDDEFTEVKFVIPPSFTGAYKYIRLRGNSSNTYMSIDAIKITKFVCSDCPAGVNAPNLSSTLVINECPIQTVDLTSLTANNALGNSIISWHTATPAADSNRVSNPSAVGAGIYYAAFYNTDSTCYSGLNGAATTRVIADTDVDCDGIRNELDLDDDNDGILDIRERIVCELDSLIPTTSNTTVCDTNRNNDKFIIWDAPSTADTIVTGKIGMGPGADDTVRVKMTVEIPLVKGGLGEYGYYHTNAGYCPPAPNAAPWTQENSMHFARKGKYKIEFSHAVYMPRLHLSTLGGLSLKVELAFEHNIKEISDLSFGQLTTDTTANTTKTGAGNGANGTIQIVDGFVKEINFESSLEETFWGMSISISEAVACEDRDLDTDGDGIPNHQDLDSDGDGCYDKYEAGISGATTNGSFSDSLVVAYGVTTGVGNNGFADNLEVVVDSGRYNGTYTLDKVTDMESSCPIPIPRLSCVDPIQDRITLKNFGESSINLSDYRFCSKSTYTANGIATDMTIVSGSLNLSPGASVTLTGFSLDDDAADLALYLPTGAYTDTLAMVDFVQWGGAGIGREAVAASKGIWTAGTYISDGPEYCYTGTGKENGEPQWDGNDAPIAKNDINSTQKGRSVTGNISINDEDPEGDSLKVSTTLIATMNGTVTMDSMGKYTFTPAAGFSGEASFEYEVCDHGTPRQCDTAKVIIEVIDNSSTTNNNVIGVTDNFIMENDTTLGSNILSNDSDPDGDSIYISTTAIENVDSGMLVINADGSFIYTPNANFVGEDNFSYQICDNGSPVTCDTVEVIIKVLASNDKNDVYASDDASSALEKITQKGNVTINDNDPERDMLTVTITPLTDVMNGTLILQANGDFSYVPNAGFLGNDQFRYKVCDNGSPQACDSATVYLTVLEKQHPPYVLPGVITIPKDSAAILCLDVTDPNEGASFTANICPGSPQSGMATVSVTGNKVCVNYQPNVGFTGTDEVCVIVCDETGRCDTTTVPVTVVAPLDTTSKPSKPVVIPSPIITPQDSTTNVCMPILDPNTGDIFNANLCSGSPANGMATVMTVGNKLCVEYTSNANFKGNDEVCVIVCDQSGLCDTIMIGVKVVPKPASPDSMQPPVIALPSLIVKEDSMAKICGPVADVNPTDTHTVMLCMSPAQGAAMASIDNNSHSVCVDYSPVANYNGKDSVCIKVCDQSGLCDTVLVQVIVIPINDAPLAKLDTLTIEEDQFVKIDVQKNDEDVEGDSLITSIIGLSSEGIQAQVIMGDSISYTPPSDFNGNDTLTYQICDTGNPKLCDTTKVIIKVNPVNDAPIALDDAATTKEDSAIIVKVQGNDSDVDGDNFVTTLIGSFSQGGMGMVVNMDSLSYTPPLNFSGMDTVMYQICDSGMPQLCDTATVIITITTVNDAPVAAPDMVMVAEDSMLVIDVQNNDTDVEGDNLTTSVIGTSTQGVAAMVVANDSVKYTPPANFNGMDTIQYQICDDGNPQLCDTSEIIITVNPRNDAPVAMDDIIMSVEDSMLFIKVKQNDTDIDGDDLTTTIIGMSTQGVAAMMVNGDSIDYTPPMNFHGRDTIQYEICDNGTPKLCDTALAIIIIASQNDKPVAMPDTKTTLEDVAVVVNVQQNDADIDGDNLTTSVLGMSTQGVIASVLSGDSIRYIPPSNFNGMDTMHYRICDDGMPQLCDTTQVIITVTPQNDAPVAMPDLVSIIEDATVVVEVQKNDSDIDGDDLTTTIIGMSTQGITAIVIHGDSLSYTPPNNFNGQDTLSYQICDNGTPQLCDTTEVIITVSPQNDAPVAMPDMLTMAEDGREVIKVQSNDSDLDGDDLITSVIGTSTQGVNVMVLGQDSLDYMPPVNFNGRDTIIYQICDTGTPQLCDTTEVVILVTPINDAPVAQPDAKMTEEDSTIIILVQANDMDIDGDELTTTIIGTSTQGVTAFEINMDSLRYTPPANFNGIDTLKYQICDNGLPQLCDTAEAIITIKPKNDAPIAVLDEEMTLEDNAIVILVQANDSDIDGDDFITTVIGSSVQGVTAQEINGDSIRYIPPLNYNGMDTLEYQICDTGSPQLCDTAKVIITIKPVNDAPVAIEDRVITAEDSTRVILVQTNDSDIDGDAITSRLIATSSQGVMGVVLSGDSIRYTPPLNFNGIDTLQYEICDNGTPQLCDTAIIIITVEARNDAPVAMMDKVTTAEDSTFIINVQLNDSDLDGDDLMSMLIAASSQGVDAMVLDGDSIQYTPPMNFNGMDTLQYKICDNGSPQLCDTTEIIITVEPRNDAPIALIDRVMGVEDSMITVQVQTNDSDIDGDSLTTNIIGSSTQGVMAQVIHGDSVSYLPPADFNGLDTIKYQICDNGIPQLCDTSEIIIDVAPRNDAPIATTDTIISPEDIPIIIDVQNNDRDIDGDSLTIMVLGNSTLAVMVEVLPNGKITYTPPIDYNGPDTIKYEICDNGTPKLCDTALVVLMITPVNDALKAIDDANLTVVNTPVNGNVLINDVDVEMDSIFVEAQAFDIEHGMVTIDAQGNYTFTPQNGFSGEASFQYKVCDAGDPSLCDTAKVVIQVISIANNGNKAIIGVEDNFVTEKGKAISASLISNDQDPDSDEIAIDTMAVSNPTNGSLVIHSDGTYTYTPAANFVGKDEFKYSVCDKGSPITCDTVLVTIEVLQENTVNNIYATDDTGLGEENQPVSGNLLVNDHDPEGDNRIINTTPIVNPQYGILTIDAMGAYIYTPNPSYIGNDRFLYEVCDNGSPVACDTASVNISILAINEIIAINDINQTTTNKSVAGRILINDFDPESDQIILNTTPIRTVKNGRLELKPDGTYIYTPNSGFAGSDYFDYEICDNGTPIACDQGRVSIRVLDILDPSINEVVGQPDNIKGRANTTLNACLICNDFDPEGDSLIIAKNPIAGPSKGSVQIDSTGNFTYIPIANFVGKDTFVYQLCDNADPAVCTEVEATITILANDGKNATFATDDANFVEEGKTLKGNVLANDVDAEGDSQHLNTNPIIGVRYGSLTLNADGSYVYKPNLGFFGNDQFVYEVCDDNSQQACDKATVYISVLPPRIKPLIHDPCHCLNNEEAPRTGQFSEKISILSVKKDEVWKMIENSGFYTVNTPVPSPASYLVPIGTIAQPADKFNGYYQYVLDGVHVDGIGYDSKFTNGKDTIIIRNTCNYDASCRSLIVTNPDGTPGIQDTCAQNLLMGTNGAPRIDSLKCCDAKTRFSDDGTVDGLYKDDQPRDDRFTICPQNQWQTLKYNFTEFGLGKGDILYVYEGRDILGTELGRFEGEGVSQTGGWVASSCAPSVNSNGCLTFRLLTNGDNNKSIGWDGNFECIEREIVLFPPNNLNAKLSCEEVSTLFEIKPATVKAGCGEVKDSQIIRIFNQHGDLCLDTCLAPTEVINERFGVGAYLIKYLLKTDTVKSAEAILTVQAASLVCNDVLNVPLGSGCSVLLTPDDILEGGCDTIVDTTYYYITLLGTDKNGKETVLTSGGGKAGNYPMVTKEMLKTCKGQIKARIEKRYYEGLNLNFCNNGVYKESCESIVNILDQTAPVFTDALQPDTFKLCNYDLTESGLADLKPTAVDACGTAMVTFEGAKIINKSSEVCDTTRVEVTWKATDDCGNSNIGTQMLVIIRPSLDDVVNAKTVVLSCEGEQEGQLNKVTERPGIKVGKIKNGQLIATDTLILSEADYTCGYILQKRDVTLTTDCNTKLFRYWDVLDWCDTEAGVIAIDTQLIEWKDTLAPVFEEAYIKTRSISLEHDSCNLDITKLEQPIATDNCSSPIVKLYKVYRIEAGKKLEVPADEFSKLTCDSFQLEWVATDACQSLKGDTIQQIIIIEDKTKPTAICRDELHLSLGNGAAQVHYKELDKGSWDACGIAKYEVSRDKVNWDSLVTFDCEDVHQEIDVYLRITDTKGNQNTCWAKVLVEDKIAPICKDLPTITESCETHHIDNSLTVTDINNNKQMDDSEWVQLTDIQMLYFNENYGNPICSDNLTCTELVIEQEYQLIKKACGSAEIRRRYRATDWNGEGRTSNWSAQLIKIETKPNWRIILPADWEGTCSETIPESRLEITNGACDLMGYEVEEKEFTTVEDACLKVVRTFTIINGCDNNTGKAPIRIIRKENHHGIVKTAQEIKAGDFEKGTRLVYVQILKIKDHTAPEIIVNKVDHCITGEACNDTKVFSISATDCNEIATTHLNYNWRLLEAGVEISKGKDSIFEALVQPNKVYDVEWIVSDNCGNSSKEYLTYNFTDCKKPSPYCLNGIAVDLIEDKGEVLVWTSDIEKGSSDNCNEGEKLEYRIWHASLGIAPTDRIGVEALPKSIRFTCAYLGNQDVHLYAIDESGNWDYCKTYVNVQDNTNACQNMGNQSVAMVSGYIADWQNRMVEQVEVRATSTKMKTTRSDGFYELELKTGADYQLVPEKLINPLNGVSTFDLVLITKHILGKELFENPYQHIAADANKSGTITAFDLVQLRKLILNIDQDFQNNTSWRFVAANYKFKSDQPLTEDFPEDVLLKNIKNERNQDFVAIKVGDVNGNARANSLIEAEPRNSTKKLQLFVSEQAFSAGEDYQITFRTTQLQQIQGYQFTMHLGEVQLNKVAPGIVGVDKFGMRQIEQGILTTSWNRSLEATNEFIADAAKLNAERVELFTLEIQANQNGKLSKALQLISRPTTIEAYDMEGNIMEVELVFEEAISNQGFELYQNEPNPFYSQTSIGFYLPGDSEVELTLRDAKGRLLRSITETGKAGYNSIQLEKEDLTTGFIYYQLSTKYGIKAKKMLQLR